MPKENEFAVLGSGGDLVVAAGVSCWRRLNLQDGGDVVGGKRICCVRRRRCLLGGGGLTSRVAAGVSCWRRLKALALRL